MGRSGGFGNLKERPINWLLKAPYLQRACTIRRSCSPITSEGGRTLGYSSGRSSDGLTAAILTLGEVGGVGISQPSDGETPSNPGDNEVHLWEGSVVPRDCATKCLKMIDEAKVPFAMRYL